MISLDTVRTAVLSDQPWTRLDELVRAEMAAGRKVKEIAGDFARMLDEVWDTPGLSEDGHDAFGDTLDALMGNCHRDHCYYDPPNTTLPTEEEIAALPRWAQVAFAARCARRVLPLYISTWPQGQEPYEVERATLAEVEESARRGQNTLRSRVAYGTVFAGMPPVAANVASALGDVALSVLTSGLPAHHALSAIHQAHSAAAEVADIQPQIRRDFDHLARLAEWQRWTDDTPVPPDVFGPLWPEGPPPGWPADPDVPQRSDLPLVLLSRARFLERMTEDEAVNLFNAINAYYIARTGDRLTMEDLRPLIAAAVTAEV